jgi:hypothetical protein
VYRNESGSALLGDFPRLNGGLGTTSPNGIVQGIVSVAKNYAGDIDFFANIAGDLSTPIISSRIIAK